MSINGTYRIIHRGDCINIISAPSPEAALDTALETFRPRVGLYLIERESESVPVTTTIHADRIDGHCEFARVGSRVVRLLPPLPGAWPWHTGDYETFYAGRDA